MLDNLIQRLFFCKSYFLPHTRTDHIDAVSVDTHTQGYLIRALVHADEHGEQFFVACQMRIFLSQLGQVEWIYGGKRLSEVILVFLAEQVLSGQLADGIQIVGSHNLFYLFGQFLVVPVQFLLAGD